MLHRLLLACPLLLATATEAHAGVLTPISSNDICLPEVRPHPNWWSPGLTPQQREARWSGASVRKEVGAANRAAKLRAVWSNPDTIYIEVTVFNDSSLDDQDALVFAVSDVDQELPELYVEFHPLENCPLWTDCSGDGIEMDPDSILYSAATPTASSMVWSPLTPLNPSTDYAIEHPWIVSTQVGEVYTWVLSFALTVPTDGAGEFMDRLMYANAIAYHPGVSSGTYYEMPLWCEPSVVSTNNCWIYGGPSPELPEDLPFWGMENTWPLVEAGGCVP